MSGKRSSRYKHGSWKVVLQDAIARRTLRLVHNDQQSVARAACTNGTSDVAAALEEWVSSSCSLPTG